MTTLDASDFRLTDNGIEQTLSVEPAEKQPLALVVLAQTDRAATDRLASYDRLDSMIESKLGGFQRKLALMTFGARVEQIWAFPPAADALYYVLTHPRYLTLNRNDDSRGAAILEAVNRAIDLIQQQPLGFRRVILLLSQPQDSSSTVRFEDVERHLAESGTTLYSLAFSPKRWARPAGGKQPADTVRDLATQSGGEGMDFAEDSDLERGISRVSEDINKSYSVSFAPSSHDAGLHVIDIRILHTPGPVKVLARRSYWVAATIGNNR